MQHSTEKVKNEVKEAVEEILYMPDHDGETVIGKEVNLHITNKGNQIISKLTTRFGIAFIALVVSGLGAWYAALASIESNTTAIEFNSSLINEGGRYTQEEADVDKANTQRQLDDINRKLDIIINQTRY